MKLYPCPHCGGPGISVARKFFLGPAIPAVCQTCKRRIGVPWTAMLAALPGVASIFLAAKLEQLFVFRILLLIAGFALTSLIHMKWVPLVAR